MEIINTNLHKTKKKNQLTKDKDFSSLSQYLNIDPLKLKNLNVFDLALPYDNRYFIDVFFMKDTNIPEFKEAYNSFMKYFKTMSGFLAISKNENDKSWISAKKMLTFKEQAGFYLGYSKSIGIGSGVGNGFANQLLKSAKEIIEMDIKDPEAFLFIPFIESGIGCDRISDMTTCILLNEFAEYTERILDDLKISNRKFFEINGQKYNLIPNLSNRLKPMLFTPKSFIRRLPSQYDWTDMFEFYSLNQKFRDKINIELSKIIGEKDASNKKNVKKDHLKNILSNNSDVFNDLIKDFIKQYPADKVMSEIAKNLVAKNPLDLQYKESPNFVLNVTNKICDQFTFLIEKKGGWKSLYKDGFHLNETHAQALFYFVAASYCTANSLDLVPELDTGRGRVDFRLKSGEVSVLVEIKLSTHSRLIHGFKNQLEVYAESEKATHSIYLVIKVFDFNKPVSTNKKYLSELRKKTNNKILSLKNAVGDFPEQAFSLKIVDGCHQESASRI